MEKILVTGSSGFIGSQIVNRLPKSVVIRDSGDIKHVDLRNREQVLKFEYADSVLHLGGKIPQNGLEWIQYFDNNIIGTLNILEYCLLKKVKKLIYVSSYVYGNPQYCPIDENHPINPHTAYAESKYVGEILCKFYSDNSDLNVTILRPFNIFGKSLRMGFIISNLIDAIKTGKKITVTNKNSKRDFLFIDDFVDLILKVLDHNFKFQIFNVGSEESYSFDDIIKKIEDITEKKFNVGYKDDKETFIDEIRANISKVKNKVGWKPKVKFNQGLQKLLDFEGKN